MRRSKFVTFHDASKQIMKTKGIEHKIYDFRIRLQRYGRYKSPFYKIVVVNSLNRIVVQVGFVNTQLDVVTKNDRQFGTDIDNRFLFSNVDRQACLYFLSKKVRLSYLVFYIFLNCGLIKSEKFEENLDIPSNDDEFDEIGKEFYEKNLF